MTNPTLLPARAQYRVLAIDAEPAMRQVLGSILGELCRVSLVSSGEEALRALEKQQVDLLLIAADLPGKPSCAEVIDAARVLEPDLAFVILTAAESTSTSPEGTTVLSQELLRSEGGRSQLLVFIDRLAREVLHRREAAFREQQAQGFSDAHTFVGVSDAASELREQIERAASCHLNVLLTGETGVGKTLIAATIHERWSGGQKRPFIVSEPAAMPPSLFESEIFGHARGAFTGAVSARRGAFEAANGGSIFLDEIGELPAALQSKLLRVVEDKVMKRIGDSRDIELDVRVIAATNRALEADVDAGRFRADLYQRLNEFRLHVPPLRERRADIVPLLKHFVAQHSDGGAAELEVEPPARQWLENYPWPGNIRELRTLARRLAHSGVGSALTADQLATSFPVRRNDTIGLGVEERIQAFGRQVYLEELAKHGFSLRETARALGLPYPTLRSRLKALDLLATLEAQKEQAGRRGRRRVDENFIHLVEKIKN